MLSLLEKLGARSAQDSQKGDTIIEVLICVSVIALAIGTGYALTNRSFRTGLASAERNQAQALAQGQVELIKMAYLHPAAAPRDQLIDQYKGAPESFCIDDGYFGTTGQNPNINNAGNLRTGSCQRGNYTIAITPRINPDTSTVFTVRVTWDSATSQNVNQTTLYYKLPVITP